MECPGHVEIIASHKSSYLHQIKEHLARAATVLRVGLAYIAGTEKQAANDDGGRGIRAGRWSRAFPLENKRDGGHP